MLIIIGDKMKMILSYLFYYITMLCLILTNFLMWRIEANLNYKAKINKQSKFGYLFDLNPIFHDIISIVLMLIRKISFKFIYFSIVPLFVL